MHTQTSITQVVCSKSSSLNIQFIIAHNGIWELTVSINGNQKEVRMLVPEYSSLPYVQIKTLTDIISSTSSQAFA
jgi:hypothetical protein